MSVALLLGAPADVLAQLLSADAGTSSIYDVSGGTFTVRSRRHELRIGAGVAFDQFAIGARARTRYRGYTFTVGDDPLDLRLPTDIVTGTRYVPTRGVSVAFTARGTHILAVAGTSTRTLGASYFEGAHGGRPLGVLFLDRRLGKTVTSFSRNIFATKSTSVHGVTWQPRASAKFMTAGGVGASQPYATSGAILKYGWIDAQAAYVATTREFRSMSVARPDEADAVRENIDVNLKSRGPWAVTATRRNISSRQDVTDRNAAVSVNQVSGNLILGSLRVGGTTFQANGDRTDHVGSGIHARYRVTQSTEIEVAHYRSHATGDTSRNTVAAVRSAIHPRLTVATYATYANGATSLKFGGQFLSNVLTFNADYQTMHAPLRQGNPFVHALMLNAIAQPFGSLRLQLATIVTPGGDVKHTVAGSIGFTRFTPGGQRVPGVSIGRYVVRGRVVDDNGVGLGGAVVRVGETRVTTDDDGRFFVRFAREETVTVAFDEAALQQRKHEPVTPSMQLRSAVDGKAVELTLTVRPLAAPQRSTGALP